MTKSLFISSMALPYLSIIFVPRTVDLSPLFLDFWALLTLGITTITLAIRAAQRRHIGQALLYPTAGLAAVILFFSAESELQHAGDYLDFLLRQPRMEANLDLLGHPLTSADSVRLRHAVYPDTPAWYNVEPAGILVCATGGAPSNMYWGYAFSPTGKKPDYTSVEGELVEWRQLTGHWYFWLSRGG